MKRYILLLMLSFSSLLPDIGSLCSSIKNSLPSIKTVVGLASLGSTLYFLKKSIESKKLEKDFDKKINDFKDKKTQCILGKLEAQKEINHLVFKKEIKRKADEPEVIFSPTLTSGTLKNVYKIEKNALNLDRLNEKINSCNKMINYFNEEKIKNKPRERFFSMGFLLSSLYSALHYLYFKNQ
jgi:hypothetical protein